MNKQQILDEIRRTAEANGGVPLGKRYFFNETGIKESDWYGKYWVRWNDAIQEAGYNPNRMTKSLSENPSIPAPNGNIRAEARTPNQGSRIGTKAYRDDNLLEKFIALTKEHGQFPSRGEIRMKARTDPEFPSHNTFGRFGSKSQLASKILEYCQGREGLEDVVRLCEVIAGNTKSPPNGINGDIGDDLEFGFVYLIKSGRYYKIGRSNNAGRRAYELKIQLPDRANKVHEIRTDDPKGIEEYWHKRFEEKRKNGEWFELSVMDVKAFKRRKFM